MDEMLPRTAKVQLDRHIPLSVFLGQGITSPLVEENDSHDAGEHGAGARDNGALDNRDKRESSIKKGVDFVYKNVTTGTRPETKRNSVRIPQEEEDSDSTENDSYGQPLDSDHEWWDQFYTDEADLDKRRKMRM